MHNNISIFIPHEGCPHTCAFCNQRSISGKQSAPSADEVARLVSSAYERITDKSDTEIAFFGGSFTAIDREYMIALLKCVQSFLGEGGFQGIRLSTRPDCISEEILDILKEYRVTAIELGAQSMDDRVLLLNERGHTAADVEAAAKLIKSYGFRLGLQMMVGLYGSTPELDIKTADRLIALSPNEVRIYPTVILKGTGLEAYYNNGSYKVYNLDTAVKLCALLLDKFENAGISVIKLGLHASSDVERDMAGGIYHPAFRELCESYRYRNLIENSLPQGCTAAELTVPATVLSKALGQKRANIEYFRGKGIDLSVKPSASQTVPLIITHAR